MSIRGQGDAPTFTDLQGQYLAFIYAYLKINRRPPAEADMQRFADFALSLVLPPNPVRPLDNQLTPDAALGRASYLTQAVDGALTCEQCHRLDASQGFFGGGTFSTFEGETQIFKVNEQCGISQR